MSTSVINKLTCVCCNNVVDSNTGIYSGDNFKCFICLNTENITKQTNFLSTLSTQKALIDSAFSDG